VRDGDGRHDRDHRGRTDRHVACGSQRMAQPQSAVQVKGMVNRQINPTSSRRDATAAVPRGAIRNRR
jgi:hypothetical protein